MLTMSIAMGVTLAQTTPTNPPTKTQPDAKSDTAASATLPEMKTTDFKGVLVDMSCSRTSTSADTTPAAGGATQTSDHPSKAPASDQSNSANRSAGDSGASCSVSANSSEFGMKLDDGKTVRFDLVGNARAQDAVKNDKKWSQDISANKPIHAKASGILNGDKLIVTSIH
jgi:hypothetical protein